MSNEEKMLTLADLLIALRNRLLAAMERHDKQALADLSTTFVEMAEASYGNGNQKFCSLLDDLEYAANHAGMGVDWKARDAIPSDEQIWAAFRSDDI